MLTLRLLYLHSAVFHFFLEAHLNSFPGVVKGLSRFSSPKGLKGYSYLSITDPLDQMGGLLREVVPKVNNIDKALFYREPRRKLY